LWGTQLEARLKIKFGQSLLVVVLVLVLGFSGSFEDDDENEADTGSSCPPPSSSFNFNSGIVSANLTKQRCQQAICEQNQSSYINNPLVRGSRRARKK
jgi:hypothetical protein